MRKRINKPVMQIGEGDQVDKSNLPFSYPAKDDIYNKAQNEVNTNPENISEAKISNEDNTESRINEFSEDDVPGSELDDAREITGNEDEENNYYSIGGDRHEDLEENKGS